MLVFEGSLFGWDRGSRSTPNAAKRILCTPLQQQTTKIAHERLGPKSFHWLDLWKGFRPVVQKNLPGLIRFSSLSSSGLWSSLHGTQGTVTEHLQCQTVLRKLNCLAQKQKNPRQSLTLAIWVWHGTTIRYQGITRETKSTKAYVARATLPQSMPCQPCKARLSNLHNWQLSLCVWSLQFDLKKEIQISYSKSKSLCFTHEELLAMLASLIPIGVACLCSRPKRQLLCCLGDKIEDDSAVNNDL